MEKGNWLEKLARQADLPGDAALPVVELAGSGRVLIEGHRGVTGFGPERICVRVSYGTVSVEGFGLVLDRMWGSQLIIRGRIDCVRIHRRKL